MKFKILLTCFVQLSTVLLYAQTLNILPSDPNIQYMGRFSFADPDAPTFSMPSTSITIAFEGTGIKANFSSSGTSFIYVIVDGNDNPYQRQVTAVNGNNNEIILASGLPSGSHVVKVVKSNEYDTKLTFNGATITGTAILSPPPRPGYQIEFYGDSNPSGWSAWDVRDAGNAQHSGAYHTYPGITSRLLGAEYSNMSAGGWGATSKTRRYNMNDAYDRIHVGDRATTANTWDFQNNYWNFSPDVVVINLGANDYYNGATESQIRDGWDQLVTSLRGHYPTAHIVMANSYGWAFQEPADYVDQFVNDKHQSGDTNISYIRFPWLWGQEHAVINEHAGFADMLAAHIANEMGWPAPGISGLSSFGLNGNVGNGSFESSLIDGFADGWRPFASWSNPTYVTDAGSAFDGTSYIHADDTYGVMHANDAAPGDVFDLSVYMKATQGNSGRLKYEFRDQGQGIIFSDQVDAVITSNWSEVNLTTIAAPSGTWQINVILEAVNGSNVDFDLVSMSKNNGTVPVSGVSVSPSSASILVGQTQQLTATISPSNATNQNLSWSSNNSSVVTVDQNGLVTAVGSGVATVTATTLDGGFTDDAIITVTAGGTATSLYVNEIILGSVSAGGPNNKGTSTVFLLNNEGNPVSNASVTGSFSGDFNETHTGTTDSNGAVLFTTVGKKKGEVSIDFCVDGIVHPALTYDPSDNVITCTGSSGARSENDSEPEGTLRIYPNPALFGEVNIEIPNLDGGSLLVIDLSGKTILQRSIEGNSPLLKLSLNKGTYILKLRSEKIKLNELIVIR